MGIAVRGIRNVLRNPLRLLLIVVVLGASLMFVASMISLNSSAQDQLQTVRKDVGTTITINYASNNRGGFQNTGNNGNTGNGTNGNAFPGGRNRGENPTANGTPQPNFFAGGRFNNDPIPNETLDTVKKVSGVVSVEASLMRFDTSGALKTSTVETPDGSTRTTPVVVNGITNGSTHFTLFGSTPTLVDGRLFEESDASANVAMMSKTLADNNSLKVGSTFTLEETKLTIIGLYTTEQNSDNSITLPMATMQKLYSVDGVDSITAYAETYDQVTGVADKIRTALGSKFDVAAGNNFYQNTFDALNVAQNSIQLALMISIVVACVVIIFSVVVIVRERTSEIGTLKAIGASHWQVIAQFWTEVLALSVLAAVVAVGLLAALGPVISHNFDIATANAFGGGNNRSGRVGQFFGRAGQFFVNRAGNGSGNASRFGDIHIAAATLNLHTLLIILGLGIGLAVLTSVIPAWYVSRIRPAEVLRKGIA